MAKQSSTRQGLTNISGWGEGRGEGNSKEKRGGQEKGEKGQKAQVTHEPYSGNNVARCVSGFPKASRQGLGGKTKSLKFLPQASGKEI